MLGHNLPGYGDPATWGPIRSPRDPRYDDSEERAREAWEEATGFIDMLPESVINGVLENVRDKHFDSARALLLAAMDVAWLTDRANRREDDHE